MAAIEDAVKAELDRPDAARLLMRRRSRRQLLKPEHFMGGHAGRAALDQMGTIGADSGRGRDAGQPKELGADANKNPGAAENR